MVTGKLQIITNLEQINPQLHIAWCVAGASIFKPINSLILPSEIFVTRTDANRNATWRSIVQIAFSVRIGRSPSAPGRGTLGLLISAAIASRTGVRSSCPKDLLLSVRNSGRRCQVCSSRLFTLACLFLKLNQFDAATNDLALPVYDSLDNHSFRRAADHRFHFHALNH